MEHIWGKNVHVCTNHSGADNDVGLALQDVASLPLSITINARRLPMASHVWDYRPFTPAVKIITLVILALAATAEIAFRLSNADRPIATSAFSLATTACFVLFLWRPPLAAIVLILLGIPGFFLGEAGGYLLALSAGAGVVVASCSIFIAVGYAAAIIFWSVLFRVFSPESTAMSLIIFFGIAVLSGAIGWGVRHLADRSTALREALLHQDERLEEELRAERTRIADELHDIVAHDIAIVAMHARVLEITDDPEVRKVSVQAIGEAASGALGEARRILHLVHGRIDDPSPEAPGDLHAELTSLAVELRGIVQTVDLRLPEGPKLARSIDAALIRMCRESTTNIAKHAGRSACATIELTYARATVTLTVSNTLTPDAATRRPLASSGYGLARMLERAEVLGGSFIAGVAAVGSPLTESKRGAKTSHAPAVPLGDSTSELQEWRAVITLPHR